MTTQFLSDMKVCFKCGGDPQPLENFYKHPKMADDHLNKCIDCAKKDVNKRYFKEFEKIKEYEKEREKTAYRKQKKLEYQRKRRVLYPEKNKARQAVSNAVRDGKLTKEPCEICGDIKSQAHHEDYTKPLDVHWYCFKHHKEQHNQLDKNTNRNAN